tara:strand:- start:9740 stop:11032 length:1293 start_codon:yes stop_codon:yes gene_type:complete
MGYIVDVQFFNTFILRLEPISPATTSELYIEESRIKGGYNEPFVSIGPKAHLVDETYAETRRNNALIYSGIYNSKTDINRTNVFSAAEPITRALDPSNGSIQKLHAEDTNLNILQEDKVSYALIDKDALFTAEGGQLTASGAAVIGQIVPYLGKYGTQNPESFAFKGMRKYFADKNRGAILRLSRDGITEISSYGMKDYFRDNLALISNAFNDNDKIIGMYDDHADEYVVSIQGPNIKLLPNNTYQGYETLSFDDNVNGWPSFYTYKPDFGFSLNKKFYTFKSNNLWQQYKNTNYNTFYDDAQPSTITIVANAEPSLVKNFNAINYEGSAGWQMFSSETDLGIQAFQIKANTETIAGEIVPKFVKKENKYYSQLMNKDFSTGDGQITGDAGAKLSTAGLKGFFTTVKMKNGNVSDNIELFSISHNIVKSS